MFKKPLVLITAISFTLLGYSQDLTSKKGETMLPEEGDYAIGFDSTPFLVYVGNFLNSGASSPNADFTRSDLAISGKMFKDAQTAYRERARLELGSTSIDIEH